MLRGLYTLRSGGKRCARRGDKQLVELRELTNARGFLPVSSTSMSLPVTLPSLSRYVSLSMSKFSCIHLFLKRGGISTSSFSSTSTSIARPFPLRSIARGTSSLNARATSVTVLRRLPEGAPRAGGAESDTLRCMPEGPGCISTPFMPPER
jgi:hypothetical protein